MSRPPQTRWRVWLPLLLGAAALAFFGDKTPVDAVVPATATVAAERSPAANVATLGAATRTTLSTRPVPQALPMDLPIDRTRLYPRMQSPDQTRDLFATVSWLPAPAAPAPAPSPRVDTSPALPTLTVVGKKYESQQWEVYLARGDQTLIAREGATIDDGLRVDRIAPPTMTLTMISTGQTMTLNIGEAR